MLKYEEKYHLDEKYKKMEESGAIGIITMMPAVIFGFPIIQLVLRFILKYIPDIKPWDSSQVWFDFLGIDFLKIDILFLAISLMFMIYGTFKLIRISGENKKAKSDKGEIPKELLTSGCYKKIRHPMYGVFVILQGGFLLSLRSLIGVGLTIVIIIAQLLNAYFEEKRQLIPAFKDEYLQYKKRVRNIILFRWEAAAILSFLAFNLIGYMF